MADGSLAAATGAEQAQAERVIMAELARWPGRVAECRDAIRLFHGRGQCFPGLEWLSVDYFAPVLWVVCYRPPPEGLWQHFEAALRGALGDICHVAIVQNRFEKPVASYCLWGDFPKDSFAVEAGNRFGLQFSGRQNIGYFMDMAPQRAWLAERVRGRRVLNLFAYTCAFSVASARAGAAEVINVDMSKSALRQGQINHAINGLARGPCQLRFGAWDIFKSWGRLQRLGPYDVVVCDPPSRQRGSFDAERQYPRLLARLGPMMAPGADLLLCLNSPHLPSRFLIDAMAAQFPAVRFEGMVAGRADFPERDVEQGVKALHFRCPQGADSG